MFGSKNPDDRPKCNVDRCGLPMFESGSFWLCSECDMITAEEIASRKS